MSYLYNLIFFEPLLNGLALLIKNLPFHDMGLAIIILTLAVRFIILPFTHKSTVTQMKMKRTGAGIEGNKKRPQERFANAGEKNNGAVQNGTASIPWPAS